MRWRALQQQLTAFSSQLLLQSSKFQMFAGALDQGLYAFLLGQYIVYELNTRYPGSRFVTFRMLLTAYDRALLQKQLRNKSRSPFPQKNFYIYVWQGLKPLSASLTKWLNTPEQFVGNLVTNCLSMFEHFVGLALKGLKYVSAT